MSENEKDNKNFDFIKEQVIEKKRKKIKKWLLPLAMTVFLAILFGIIAAVTFVITEPKLYKYLHKEEETKTPVSFPTEYPNNPTPAITKTPNITTNNAENAEETEETTAIPDPVIVQESIEADLDDFTSMYDEIRSVAYEVKKSIVNVTSTATVTDWFGKSVENTIKTTGVIIYNNNEELLILVSLDRVKDANSVKLEFSDTVVVDAVLHDYESELNLAIVAVDIEDIPPIYMNSLKVANPGESYTITVGNPILALGSPNGYPGSMELGIVTSRGSYACVSDNKLDLFNTDVTDNENSDGIIVNLNGDIIGIITRTLKDEANKDLNTVIGISKIKPYIERMGNLEPRIYFGVKADDMTEITQQEHNVTNGIYVNEVLANSPAFEAGMMNGDIILQVDDLTILNTNNFYNTITGYQPEEEITVKIQRTYGTTTKEIDIKVVLKEKEQ